MTDLDRTDPDDVVTADDTPVDGRVARRQRNIDVVLDVVLDMFGEDALFPTMEQAATRSGLSLRSLYRYFADPGELLEAAIKRSRERGTAAVHLHSIGKGPFAQRLDDFVAARVGLYEAVGPIYRATTANAERLPRIQKERSRNRRELGEQFAAQFAPELGAMDDERRAQAFTAGDLLSQIESLDFMRRHRGLSVTETEATLRSALLALLG
ncbi:MAG: TetR/AcrR family transcriptional regulator [Actinomycetota bacterium]